MKVGVGNLKGFTINEGLRRVNKGPINVDHRGWECRSRIGDS